jgi:hypothetical protein
MKMGHPPGPFIGAGHMSFIDKTNEELKDVMAPLWHGGNWNMEKILYMLLQDRGFIPPSFLKFIIISKRY